MRTAPFVPLLLIASGMAAVAAPAQASAPLCFGMPATMVVPGDQTQPVWGTKGDDVIVAKPGADVHALGGNDRICGTQYASGGYGNDRIAYDGPEIVEYAEFHGGPGADRIFLNSPAPAVIIGGGGPDRIATRGGAQTVYGGGGNDVITGGRGNDELVGGAGHDEIGGGYGRDRCEGEVLRNCELPVS
jgi:Ca2+-binding RTX toxin-like protein